MMVLNQIKPTPIPDPDDNTASRVLTPSDTVSADMDDDDHHPFGSAEPTFPSSSLSSPSVPWPGSTFMIRSVSSGQVITLLDGQITLASPGDPGSHWVCVETKGWLGFRNLVSGRFLGHDGKKGRLCCTVERHRGWEKFHARMRPEGGYVLLMTHFEDLWPVGIKAEQGVEMLAKIEDHREGGPDKLMAWEFIKV